MQQLSSAKTKKKKRSWKYIQEQNKYGKGKQKKKNRCGKPSKKDKVSFKEGEPGRSASKKKE